MERLNYYSFSIPHESLVPADKVAMTDHEAEEALDACLRRLAVEDAANAAAAGAAGAPLATGAAPANAHSSSGSGHDAPHLSIRVPPPANPPAAVAVVVPAKAADKAAVHDHDHPVRVPTAAAVAAAAAATKEAELLHFRSHDQVYDGWHPRFFNAALARKHWPVRGEIVFKEVSLRYRDGLPLVLRNVNLRIQPGHTVGVVGRTGAGKT